MELEDTSIGYINSSQVSTVSNLELENMDIFSKMADANTINFTMPDTDHIYFFQKWFNEC